MKIFKLLSISISLVVILSSCNLPSRLGTPTQTIYQNLTGTAVAMTLLANPTRTQMTTVTLIHPAPTMTASPISTQIPPNVPVWSAYNYTCELAVGGGTMMMNLAWADRSNSEESYIVYRDGQAIATLEPNSTFYVDVAFVAAGKTLSYTVEAFNENWQASTSTITYGCQ